MEVYQEFLLTTILSILLFFLLGKLAAAGEHDPGVTGGASEGSAKSSPEEKNHDASLSKLRNSENNSDLGAGVPGDRIVAAETQRHEDLSEDREAKVEFEREIAGVVDLKKEKEEEEEEEGWKGIEHSELEKLFALATAFTNSERGAEELSKLSGDVQMHLYALHKVATEGPCYQPQPIALKLSARTKWNAWQRLGSMTPEVAMEQYISLLSENIHGWIREGPFGNTKLDKGNDQPVVTEASSHLEPSTSKLDSDILRNS